MSSPEGQSSTPTAGQAHIMYLAAKLLDSLEEAEDTLWDADEDEVASMIGRSLQAVAAMLDEVRDKLPRTDEERASVARNLLSYRDRATRGAEELSALLDDPDSARRGRTVGARTQPTPSSHRTLPDEFSASMARARAQLLAELRSPVLVGESGAAAREDAVTAQLLVVEAALEDVRDAISSVDSDDLRQVCERESARICERKPGLAVPLI
jgi:hypothetical protein